ncbi:MAG: AAA family ATPase, partial [Anaerolineales bacterium]
MRNLVPHFILEKYNSGETHGSLPAVGIFVDISGFSRITDELMEHGQHGAEVIADLMSNLFTPLIQITYEQGGFISTLAGDAFTAIFPMEEDEETTCLRTLSAAWQIQQDFEALTKQSTPFGEFSISGKIGIAKGEAIWGIVTSNDKRRATFYFAGSAVEESAEAEGKASSGEVLVNAQFQSVIGNSADFVLQDEHFKVSRIDFQLLAPKTIHPTSTESNLAFKFYPPTLFNQAHSGEFRQVVTMFINLPTVRTEDQLDIFMDSLFGLQDKYGGLLTRLDFGDKGSNLLMFWGAPVAFENDIERALNLILNLQIVTSIPINAGITYRIAHAGFIGSSLREEYSTYGRGVNLAARFMSAANRGEIWVDEEIAKRAEDKFEIIFDDEYSFKGFAQKQKVYLLEERKEAIEAIYQTDLVGRQAELKEMADFIRPLSENQYCGGLILLGDPGIGKTRLVNEFSNHVKGDIQWALCQCDQTMRESFHPISYWLRQYFSISAFQNEARNKRNFNRKIDRVIASLKDDMLAAELDRTRSFLGALIELYWPDSLYEQVDPQGRYDNTLIGLVSLIQAESSFQPLILQLEDAQWLDEDSWKLLAQLDRTIKSNPDNSFPIAIFATARLEFLSTPLTDGITFEELRIGELSDKSLKGLADQILGGPISPRLLELLEGRADGNPFFAEQIAHYLLDEEKLRKVNGVWDIGDSTQSPLPDNIRALLISRIDRLAQEVKEVVLTAAVLGKEFEIRLLSYMLNGDLNLVEKIEEAERQSIWSKISELRYLFTHALLLDAAYQMQVHSRRQALHKSAVQAIESLYAEETSAHSTDLAYHCEMAGLADKARNYLIQAAKIAKKDYQNTQAIDLYSRALNLTPEKDFSTRYEILYEREKIFSYLGQPENQVADLEQLGQLINTEEDKFSDQEKNKYLSKLAAKWANYKIETGDYKGAITSVEEMISIAEIENLKEDLVDAYFLWAISSYHLGFLEEAAKQGSTGLSNASSLGYLDGEANLLNLMGLIALGMDKPKEAQDYFEHSLDLAMKVGNLRDQA